MTKNLYIFSGLGADESVFQDIDLTGFGTTHIAWVVPDKEESIENYAARLSRQIKTDRPVLIGLSFGGLIAVEIAKQMETEKVILIASAKTGSEIPFYFRWVGKFRLHKLLPARLLKKSNIFSNWFFGVTTSREKRLLKTILAATDPVFLKWAIDTAVKWKNKTRLKNLIQLHGTNDRILPLCFVTCDIKIENGGHFMTVNKAKEISNIIWTILK